MPSVPIVAPVIIVGPVAAQADEDELAVIIWPEKAKSEARAPRIADRPAAVRPRDPVKYPV